ncbi:histidine kinase dimerization/phospho-acceptor domain-containing protein [Frigidibacter mobilis]|uniref:histidine kinase dimerization/phospho-acceptor domain-containing protein n=1 Tax=Frigidibacter mobilis TaxID=1335048 RepID=UPI000A035E61|nr:HAMP domain-containing sensor histidine kinase [Frigidibacter mobilis]
MDAGLAVAGHRARAGPASFPVTATFGLMDRLIAEDVEAAPNATETVTRARQGITLARVRGQFTRLERTLQQAPPGTPEGDAALALYGAQVPGLIAAQIHQETRRREAALAAMAGLRGPLHALALAIAIGAPLLLVALYLALLRPVLRRLAAGGEGAVVHDELGLLFARVRQMTARLDRRARSLAADRARLEALVAERTADLSAANARLSRADVERRRFFADVGHELRTPLTVILGEAELGERHDDPALRASFRTIHSRALRLARRIEDLLRIARSDSGRLDLDCQPVDLAAAARAALDDMAPCCAAPGGGGAGA